MIRPGGAFLVYQFSPKVRDFIKPHFERIERGFEWINVPPATLFWAWREPTPTSACYGAEVQPAGDAYNRADVTRKKPIAQLSRLQQRRRACACSSGVIAGCIVRARRSK